MVVSWPICTLNYTSCIQLDRPIGNVIQLDEESSYHQGAHQNWWLPAGPLCVVLSDSKAMTITAWSLPLWCSYTQPGLGVKSRHSLLQA